MGKLWFLEHVAADGSRVRHKIARLPCRIGREPAMNDYVVDGLGLSRQHALLEAHPSGQLLLTDHNSTNGTTVNGTRVQGACLVKALDIIHFAGAEFRLGAESLNAEPATGSGFGDEERTMIRPSTRLSQNFVQHEREFMEVLAGHGLAVAVQPIIDLATGGLYAYEMLGRCRHPGLREPPGRLFHLAERLNLEAELSAAFCRHGIPRLAPRLGPARLFINAHPKETFTEAFFQSLKAFRALPSAPRIVVELHETAVVKIEDMRELARRLVEIGLEFAYDDYGAGQSRINEVTLVTPHYVKFDMSLVNGIAQADARRRDYIRKEVATLRDMGAMCLAEGVEAPEDGEVCRELGFQLIQGYLTGRPEMVD